LASDEDCTTISFGFRAPNYKTLLTAFWEEITGPEYVDPSRLFHSDVIAGAMPFFDVSTGLITPSVIESMGNKLENMV